MKKMIFLITASLFFIWNCEQMPDMSDLKDTIPPGPISNPIVSNKNGGAIITYNLPNDKDLLGVKALYSLKDDGKELSMFSSAFRDTISLTGFADTKERNVTLICIDKSFNESVPVNVKINPLTPPIDLIRETVEAKSAFGGIGVNWINTFNENIAVSVYAEDSLGFMVYDDTHYSKVTEGQFSFRGFQATETRFRIEIRDRWDNYAEPYEFTLTPLFEEEILPKHPTTFEVLWDIAYGAFDDSRAWRGDIMEPGGGGWPALWSNARHSWGLIIDGDCDVYNNRWAQYFKPQLEHYFPNSGEEKEYFYPAYFIFDLKEEILPSRFRIWPYYTMTTFPLKIEIWGTNSTPKGPEDFNNISESLSYWTEWYRPPYVEGTDAWKEDWIKLGGVQVRPTPSGAFDVADFTPEDIEIRDRGYEVEVEAEKVGTIIRYVRFVYIDVPSEQCYTSNIKIWGQYVNRKW